MDKLTDKARIARTVTGTATTALAALFMVGAITFGASVLRPMTANQQPDASAAQENGAGNGAFDGGEATDPDQPDANGGGYEEPNENQDQPDWQQPDKTPLPEPTEKPQEPEPTAKPQEPAPTDKPAPSSDLWLEAFIHSETGKVVVKWSAFEGYFEKYKLVRSTDGSVSWPEGEGDTLVGVVGAGDMTKFYDTSAPCGVELHYRVFAVKHGESGYVVMASSNVDGVVKDCSAEPTPGDPYAMGFELWQVDGGVKLHWEACTSGDFAVYKVVRSATNANPLYPLNDGTELLAAIGDPGVTYFFDGNVEPGQTFTYRILALASTGSGWVVLGQTAAMSITVE